MKRRKRNPGSRNGRPQTEAAEQGSDGGTPAFWLLATLLYTATALYDFVLPLGRRFGSALLVWSDFPYDNMLNAGILEWTHQCLRSSNLRIFEWTAGFPIHDSLAVTENLVGWQLLYSPLRWGGVGVVSSYNVLIVVSFIISGVAAAALALHFETGRAGALIAGFVFAFIPFHMTHALHIQTMSVCWSPFAILFLDRFLDRPTWRDAAGLGASIAITTASGIYFGVFLVLVLGLVLVLSLLVRRRRIGAEHVKILVPVALLTILVLLPLVLPYVRFARVDGYRHSADVLFKLSVKPQSFLLPPLWQAIWLWARIPWSGEDAAFPGIVALVLASIFYFSKRTEDEVKNGRLLGLLLVICAVLSMGPQMRVAGQKIPLPGAVFLATGAIRWPMRLLLYADLALAILCGLGVRAIQRRIDPRRHAITAAAVLTLLFFEYRPASWFASKSLPARSPIETSDTYGFLAGESDRGAVVELPGEVGGYRTPPMCQYVYGSAGHLRRVVAIHGSVRPREVDALQKAAESLPSEPARQMLAQSGVTRLVVHRAFATAEQFERTTGQLAAARLPLIFRGVEGNVYDLTLKER